MTRDLLSIGKALAAPARVAMITVLFDGVPHPAGELAAAAGVSSATASEHLGVLTAAGIVRVETSGRHRYYTLADADLAHALEQLAQPPPPAITSLHLSREQSRVRLARTCYDHLAGRLGVALAERFVVAGWVDPALSTLSSVGRRELATHFGVELDGPARRPDLRGCLDWTERRPHLAGRLGAALATSFLDARWVRRQPGSRGLTVTRSGHAKLADLGVDVTSELSGR